MIDMEKITLEISARSGSAVFAAASAGERAQAAALAEQDVLAFTGGTADWEDPLSAGAVAEQCLFLLNTQEEQNGRRSFIASETVEGAGSVTYAESRRQAVLSPRAEACCRTLLRRRNRITRG